MSPIELSARKALLLAEAERERLALARAWHDVRTIISPPADHAREARVQPFTSGLVRTLLPLLGFTRFGKLLRMMTIGLTAYRVVRGWK